MKKTIDAAQVATIVAAVLGTMGGSEESKTKAAPIIADLPKIQGAVTSIYKSQKGHVSLQVVSTEEKVELPNGSSKPLQLFIGNIYKADGSIREKGDLKFTISNLKKEAELQMMVADELEKHFQL